MINKYKKTFDAFCEDVKAVYGTKIRSVVVYGSIVSNEFIKNRSNINILIILDKVHFDTLTHALGLVRKWKHKAKIFPIIIDQDYINKSVDVFPIEFLDMKENNHVLYGLDVLKEVKIDLKNLKFQCEQELKGKIIRLRQAYLETGLHGPALEMVMVDSIPAIVAIFRAILRLKGKVPPLQKDQVIKEIAEMFNFNEDIGLRLLKIRKGEERIYSKAKEVLFRDWLFELETLSKAIDETQASR